MKLDGKMNSVLAELEYCVGKECFNGNSYDGWTGTQGCGFRYPVCISDEQGEDVKYRSNISDLMRIYNREISDDEIKSMKYKFGSNNLYIGHGIVNILNYLENRYDLDFNELENGLAE